MSERTAVNRITRINYSPVPKFVLPMVMGAVTGNVLESPVYNTLGAAAGWLIAESELKLGSYRVEPFPFRGRVEDFLTRGFVLSTFVAIMQLDPRAYIPFIAGAVSGQAIHLGAKALYDSGLTKPIYKVLRIQDRRLLPV